MYGDGPPAWYGSGVLCNERVKACAHRPVLFFFHFFIFFLFVLFALFPLSWSMVLFARSRMQVVLTW